MSLLGSLAQPQQGECEGSSETFGLFFCDSIQIVRHSSREVEIEFAF